MLELEAKTIEPDFLERFALFRAGGWRYCARKFALKQDKPLILNARSNADRATELALDFWGKKEANPQMGRACSADESERLVQRL